MIFAGVFVDQTSEVALGNGVSVNSMRAGQAPQRAARRGIVTAMANELIPFPSGTKTGSNSIFTRQRLIARVANLRYEIEIIGIITPLRPARKPKQPALARSAAVPNERKQAPVPISSAQPAIDMKSAGTRKTRGRR